tara:strand:- start:15497 stop:16708 length:1212 start_codon:yes stop_codon:yes gene_type:complete
MKINNYLIGLAAPSVYGFIIFCIIAIQYQYYGLGVLSTILAIILITSLLINFGTSPWIIRISANSQNNLNKISYEFSNAVFINLFISGLIYFLILITEELNFSLFGTGNELFLKLLVISFITSFNKNINAIYIGLNHDKNFMLSSLIRGTTVLIYILFQSDEIFNLVVNGILLGEISYVIFWIFKYKLTFFKIYYFNKSTFITQAKFGYKHIPTSLSDEAIYRIDVLMIGFFKGPTIVGLYSIISLGLEVLRELARTTFVTRSSYIIEKDNYFSKSEIIKTRNTLIKVALILFTLGLIGAFIGLDVLKLFTNLEIQNNTKLYLFIFSTITALLSSNIFLKEVLPHINLPGLNSVVSVLSLIINVVCNFYLIPRYDILGALLASSFSVFVALILRFLLLKRSLF